MSNRKANVVFHSNGYKRNIRANNGACFDKAVFPFGANKDCIANAPYNECRTMVLMSVLALNVLGSPSNNMYQFQEDPSMLVANLNLVTQPP
jgi:hypothetical protein